MPGEACLLLQRTLSKEFDLPPLADQHTFSEQLAFRINQLIQKDFASLVNILYRIDVNELKLNKTLREHPMENAGYLIANLIIERQLQKIKAREEFRDPSTFDDSDERW